MPRKSRIRGRAIDTSLSIISYMRSPRSVTRQPMDMPSRSLKPAIDLRALVIAGRWPVIWASSSTASSSSFAFVFASPTPMLSVTFATRGTSITLRYPNSSLSSGTISLKYFSLSLAICLRLVDVFAATGAAAGADLAAVPGQPVPDTGGLAARGADEHHVGRVDRRLALDHAALRVGLRVRLGVLLHHVEPLEDDAAVLGVDTRHLGGLPRLLAAHDPHLVALL